MNRRERSPRFIRTMCQQLALDLVTVGLVADRSTRDRAGCESAEDRERRSDSVRAFVSGMCRLNRSVGSAGRGAADLSES